MQTLRKELQELFDDVVKNVGAEWEFYIDEEFYTDDERSSLSFTHSIEEHFAEFRVRIKDGEIEWQWKKKDGPVFLYCDREKCLRRITKDIKGSQTYQLLMMRKQLETMNSNFNRFFEFISNEVELSPDNERTMKALGDHFQGLSKQSD
ncbi:hypothetical protein ISTM_53 [Insectomime virus]|nr:hypothetical protein ISTM_53 [Insectomime virus]